MFEVLGVQVNLLAIILAAVANILFGTLWYSPILFSKTWLKLVGKKPEELQMKTIHMVYATIAALLLAVGLNSVLQFAFMAANQNGMVLSELANVFLTPAMVTGTFVIPALANGVIWEDRNKKLFLLNVAHSYFQNVVMCFILTLFVI
jgi:hypothetical protein